jgi:hypothetical protein
MRIASLHPAGTKIVAAPGAERICAVLHGGALDGIRRAASAAAT